MLNIKNNQTAPALEAACGRGLEGLLGRANEARAEVPFGLAMNSLPAATRVEHCPREAAPASVWLESGRVKTILMPFDFTAASARLLAWLASLAEQGGFEISLLHVVSPWVSSIPGGEPCHHDVNEDRLAAARARLKRELRGFGGGTPGIAGHVAMGNPADEIVRHARSAKPDLIIMPAYGHRRFRSLLRCTTLESVTRRACCPVLSIPEAWLNRQPEKGVDRLGRCSRIVVPTDFSVNSASALRCAAALARAHGSRVYVLNFPGREHRSPGSGAPGEFNRQVRLESWLRAQLESTDNVRAVLGEGGPSVYMLVRQAELLKADLIMLGTRSYAWTERFRLNSTTDGILRHASCPVLSLRAGTNLAGC